MKTIANKTFLKVKPYVPGKPIEEVQRELRLKEVIKLASNESPFGPSPKVRKAIAIASRDINRYPDGDCFYLRRELAKRLKLKSHQLIFGNGSDELIVLAVKAFIHSGDEVIIAKPSFLIYDIAARIGGAKVKAIALKNFCYDLKAMKKAITRKTKIIFIGNPDNPGGTYLTNKEIEAFLKGIRPNILVFLDEAYYEFVKAKDYVNSVKLIKSNKNLMITRTFSKMYGLAGLRIGYGMADGTMIDILNRGREPFNVNSIAQAAALACLKDQAYYREVGRKLIEQRKYLYKNFKRLNLEFQKSCTNFILLKVNKSGTKIAHDLLHKGVIVRDMSFWGLNAYIRITIGSLKENRKLIRKLEEVL